MSCHNHNNSKQLSATISGDLLCVDEWKLFTISHPAPQRSLNDCLALLLSDINYFGQKWRWLIESLGAILHQLQPKFLAQEIKISFSASRFPEFPAGNPMAPLVVFLLSKLLSVVLVTKCSSVLTNELTLLTDWSKELLQNMGWLISQWLAADLLESRPKLFFQINNRTFVFRCASIFILSFEKMEA